MNIRRIKRIASAFLLLLTVLFVTACTGDRSGKKEIGFSLINNDKAATIYVEGENQIGSTSGDYPGVVRAAYDLEEDIYAVTGKKPTIVNKEEELKNDDYAIIIGSVEKSALIKKLAENGKINTSPIEGKWETYIHQLVDDPFADGSVKKALVVAGSDKRGTIYGIYKISSLIGVSPWSFWADQVPNHLDNYSFEKGYYHFQDEPTVQYRGIFFNDEEELASWVVRWDNGVNMGPNFYEHVYELLLRLNANYLWPAMHGCSDAFNDHEENRILADYYGIVIGTSHVDMMMRNNNNEWDTWVAEYKRSHNYNKEIEYDYTVNPEILQEYWRSAVRLYKDYEVQYSLGMRGVHDVALPCKNIDQAPWYGDKVKLLEQIIEDQRQILREELNNPTLENVFMVFTPYKEVQEVYNQGMNLPEDITILWVDDNHGFIRQLSNSEERTRSGGSGVYYHNSYWGPDNESYMWLNSMPLTMVYEEMSKAVLYGAVKNWILNVGDLKPDEFSCDFFLSYAYDADKYQSGNVYDFAKEWGEREFGSEFAERIGSVLKRYGQYTNVRKLEQIQVDLYTNVFYSDEYERQMALYQKMLDDAEAIFAELPEHKKLAFYETVLYQVRQAFYRNAEFYYGTKANTAAKQGRSATAFNANEMARYYFELSNFENSYYTKVMSAGKWEGLLEPYKYSPPVASGPAETGASLVVKNGANVVVEGEYYVSGTSRLNFYNYSQGRKFIDVFNTGSLPVAFQATADRSWIKLSKESGQVYDEERIWVEIDWNKVSSGENTGTVTVDYGYGTKEIKINARKDNLKLKDKTYVEQDGYLAIELEHYSSSRSTPEAHFETIKDLGRIEGDMVRAYSQYLVGYSALNFQEAAPYLEYNVYFLNKGTFEAEVYRLPTLDANGKIRFAVQVDDQEPIILEGENDYGVGNYNWEEGIFNQIFRHQFSVNIPESGMHKIRLYMIDPFLTFDKMVIYTEGKEASYLGPEESYNSTFNRNPGEKTKYERFYQTRYLPTREQDLTKEWGEGYFYEDGSLLIEAEIAAEQSKYAYTTNPVNEGWLLSRNLDGYTMRTKHDPINYLGQSNVPTLNYQIAVNNPGTFNVWLRYNAPMPSADSLTFSVNGTERFRVEGGLFSWNNEETFLWKKIGTLGLTKGIHTLNILAAETGLIIDKIYLTKTSENPANIDLKPAVRTVNLEDVELKKALQASLLRLENIYNIPVGTVVGSYSETLVAAFFEKYQQVLDLYNSTTLLEENRVETAISELNTAYAELASSQIKLGEDKQNYILYEDYALYSPGLVPFGLKTYAKTGSPNTRIASGKSNYLAVRTLNEQAIVQSANMYYDFGTSVSGEMIVETRAKFNHAVWGYVAYLLDDNYRDVVSVAFENSNGVNTNIVAYDGNSKRVIGKFTLNEWVDFRIEINTLTQTFNVYLNGKLATAKPLSFRRYAEGLRYYRLGASVADADLGFQYIKVYRKNDYQYSNLEDIKKIITSIPTVVKGADSLTLPSVPKGFALTIKSSSNPDLVDLDGKITIPVTDSEVELVLTIKDLTTEEEVDTEPLKVIIPGVSSEESKNYLLQAIIAAKKDIHLLPIGNALGLYSQEAKENLEDLISEAEAMLSRKDLTMSEVKAMEAELMEAYEDLFASRIMTEERDGKEYTYYAYEDFDAYANGAMPYGIKYLPSGVNSAGITNGMYRLVTGSTGQAYNRLDLTSALSGIVTVEVGVIHKSTAAGTFANLIFLMTEKSDTPVASIAFDRPGSSTTLKYHDGSGWKTSKQVPGTNITYTPGEYAVVKAVFDLNAGVYDVYYNGVLVYEDVSFRYPAGMDSISYLNFGTTKANEEILFDFIKVYKEE